MPWNVTFTLDADKEEGEVGTAIAEWTEPGEDEPCVRFSRRIARGDIAAFVRDAKRERAAVLRRKPKETAVAGRLKGLLEKEAG